MISAKDFLQNRQSQPQQQQSGYDNSRIKRVIDFVKKYPSPSSFVKTLFQEDKGSADEFKSLFLPSSPRNAQRFGVGEGLSQKNNIPLAPPYKGGMVSESNMANVTVDNFIEKQRQDNIRNNKGREFLKDVARVPAIIPTQGFLTVSEWLTGKREIKPKSVVGKTLLREEGVSSYTKMGEDAATLINKISEAKGKNLSNTELAFISAGISSGAVGLDFFFGGKGKFADQIVKATTKETAEQAAKRMGINATDEILETIIKINSKKAADNFIKEAKTYTQEATKQYILKNADSLNNAAKKDFVKIEDARIVDDVAERILNGGSVSKQELTKVNQIIKNNKNNLKKLEVEEAASKTAKEAVDNKPKPRITEAEAEKNIVVQRINPKTNETTYHLIPEGQKNKYVKAIDTSTEGNMAGTVMDDGYQYHITASSPAKMRRSGFKEGEFLKVEDIPKLKDVKKTNVEKGVVEKSNAKRISDDKLLPKKSTNYIKNKETGKFEGSYKTNKKPKQKDGFELLDKMKKESERLTNNLKKETLTGKRESKRMDNYTNIDKSSLSGKKSSDTVTVYRASQKEINIGDQITTSLKNAKKYLNERPNSKIRKKQVRIDNLVKSEGLKNEFIFAPKNKVSKVGSKKEAFGGVAGFEQDEDGNIKFNPIKAAIGIGAMKVASKGRKTTTKTAVLKELAEKKAKNKFVKKLSKDIAKKTSKAVKAPIKSVNKQIGLQMKNKNISKETIRRIANGMGIKEWKNASKEQVDNLLKRVKTLKEGDRMPTPKQMTGLKKLYPDKNFENKTIREIAKSVGAGDDPLSNTFKRLISYVEPTIRTKRVRGDMFKRVLDNIQYGEQMSFIRKKVEVDKFDKLLKKAYKSSSMFSKKQKTWERVFNYLDTGKGELKSAEKELAEHMKDYFAEAKKYLIKNGDMARGRTYYVTHRAAELKELIADNGLLNGINKWTKNRKFVKQGAGLSADIWVNLDNIMGTNKFFKFALQRKGALTPSKNVERIFKEYMSLFETKKFLDDALPQIHAAANILTPNSGNAAKWLMQYGKQLKGRQYGFMERAIDKTVSFNYIAKLGFRHISAMKNLIGGETNNFIENGFLRLILGKKRLATQPFKTYKLINKYGFLSGYYVDVAKQGLISKAAQGTAKAAFIEQKLVEMEIRTSQIAGLLTRKEFKTGKISKKRILDIMDNLESTQGVFTAARSPLAVRTPYGRAALQFSRWVITNTDMSTRIVKGSFVGKQKAKNLMKLGRMLTAFIAGGYLATEFGKAGYDNAKKYVEVLQEPIKATIKALDGELATQAIADNPSLQVVAELNHSLKWVAWKMGIGDMPQKIEFKKGITETYLAPKRQLEEMGLLEGENAYQKYLQLKKLSPSEANKKFKEIKKADPQEAGRIEKYVKWDKLKLTDKERNFARLGVKDGSRAKNIYKYIMKQSKREETYKKLIDAGIITDEVAKQIKQLTKQ